MARNDPSGASTPQAAAERSMTRGSWVLALALVACGGRASRSTAAGGGSGDGAQHAAGGGAGAGRAACAFDGFAPAVTYGVAHEPGAIVPIDRTRDGHADLLVAESAPDGEAPELFVNRGDGTFRAEANYGAPDNDPENMVVADWNGDGLPDLVSHHNAGPNPDADSPGVFGVDFGTSDGRFAPSLATLPSPRADGAFVAGDFDGDGHADLAYAGFDYVMVGGKITPDGLVSLPAPEPADSLLSVFLNQGDGSFGAPTSYATDEVLQYGDIRAGDFDGDGHTDLAELSTREPSGIDVRFNAGNGTFEAGTRAVASETWVPYGLAVADFDGDGADDLATTTIIDANLPSETLVLEVFSGSPDRTLHGPASYPISSIPQVYVLVPGDFNGDGHPDIAMVMNGKWGTATPIPIDVYENLGDGTFGAPTRYVVGGQAFQFVIDVAGADLNGDGVTDLAVTTSGEEASPEPESLTVLLSSCE